jgi:membrane associated rhomboid family serine protease
MFPLRDVIPSRTTPIVTYLLIAINAVVFFYEVALAPRSFDAFIAAHALVPAHVTPGTILTSMFLHSGWMHIIGNMWSLWIFGDNVEDRLGHLRYLGFYLGAGVIAALTQVWMGGPTLIPMLGASGAIAGVMGAYLVLFPKSRVQVLVVFFVISIVEVPAVFFLGVWFLMQMLSGIGSLGAEAVGGVAFWAHLGGFLTGVASVKLLERPERREHDWWEAT